MKFNYLIKASPLLSTVLLVIFICINNHKEYTKLRILVWDTPSLKLSSYLAISTGTGFIFSYFITSSLAKKIESKPKESLKFKEQVNEEVYRDEYIESTIKTPYDNTLIERDIKDPSPTINANFRIIGKTQRTRSNFKTNNNFSYDVSTPFEEKYDEQRKSQEPNINVNSISCDWNDESYSTW